MVDNPKPTAPKKGPGVCMIIALIFGGLVGLFFLALAIAGFYGAYRLGGALQKTGLRIDPTHGSVSLKNPETGEKMQFGTGNTIPADFPNVPIYPGSKVVAVVSGNKSPSLTLGLEGTYPNLTSWYKTELPKKSWRIISSQEGAIEFENIQYKGSLFIIGANKQTSITITLDRK